MGSSVETIDMTPSREATIQMLQTIVENSTNADDVQWAKAELEKAGVAV